MKQITSEITKEIAVLSENDRGYIHKGSELRFLERQQCQTVNVNNCLLYFS